MTKWVLVSGWGLYFVCIALLLGFPKHLVHHWTLEVVIGFGILLVFTSVTCVPVWALRGRASNTRNQIESKGSGAQRLAQRLLLTGWILCVAGLSVELLFPRASWVPSPEALLVFVLVVVLSSLTYAAILFLGWFHKHLR